MKLVILDRDGVINQDSEEFIKSPEEWIPIPGSLEAIARLHREGYRVIVISNQSGIARGMFDTDTLLKIHGKMIENVRARGGDIDAIFFCPHGPDDGCRCRKPLPGLFEQAMDRLKVDLRDVYAVGDAVRDLEAANAVGAHPVLVLTGKGKRAQRSAKKFDDVPVYDDLAGFTDALLAGELPALDLISPR